jgi:hypothetical protein
MLHHVQQAAVNRLQAIAHIRECPVHDGRQGVGEIALLKGILEVDALDFTGVLWRGNVLAHDSWQIAQDSARTNPDQPGFVTDLASAPAMQMKNFTLVNSTRGTLLILRR